MGEAAPHVQHHLIIILIIDATVIFRDDENGSHTDPDNEGR